MLGVGYKENNRLCSIYSEQKQTKIYIQQLFFEIEVNSGETANQSDCLYHQDH